MQLIGFPSAFRLFDDLSSLSEDLLEGLALPGHLVGGSVRELDIHPILGDPQQPVDGGEQGGGVGLHMVCR